MANDKKMFILVEDQKSDREIKFKIINDRHLIMIHPENGKDIYEIFISETGKFTGNLIGDTKSVDNAAGCLKECAMGCNGSMTCAAACALECSTIIFD